MKVYKIYIIKNTINNKLYVGYTTQTISKRFNDHVLESKRNPQYKIHRAIKKYGKENFIIEEIYNSNDKKHINDMEDYFIKLYNTQDDQYGYNIANGGQGGNIKTKEQLEKQSLQWCKNNIIHEIKNDPVRWEDWMKKRKESAKNIINNENWKKQNKINTERFINNNPGKNKSNETKKRLSVAQKNRNTELTISPCILYHENNILKVFLMRKEVECYCIENKIPRWNLLRKGETPGGEYKLIWLEQKRIEKNHLKTISDSSLANEQVLKIVGDLKPTTSNLQTLDT